MLYKSDEESMIARRALMNLILGWAGVERVVDWTPAKAEVWARRAPGGRLFLFALNDGPETVVHISPALPDRLGLDPAKNYRITQIYKDKPLDSINGEQMIQKGLRLPMSKWESEVLLLEPE